MLERTPKGERAMAFQGLGAIGQIHVSVMDGPDQNNLALMAEKPDVQSAG